jgi:hypothetical protein
MMPPAKYVKEAVVNVERHLGQQYDSKCPKRVSGKFPLNYRPEIGVTKELEGTELSYYQSQIGVLRCIVELGWIDIITDVSSLASCLALPRKGHLRQFFNFTPTYADVDLTSTLIDWSNFYGNVRELTPSDMP